MLAVPDEYIDQSGLIGPVEEYVNASLTCSKWATGLIIRTTDTSTIELIAEITESEYGLEYHDHSQVEAQTKVIGGKNARSSKWNNKNPL